MFIKVYSVGFYPQQPWAAVILYKYLFVRLTSLADLQPCLMGEERESLQALQHHLPRKQSPLFWQGLFISRFCPLADIHRPKT